MDGSPTAGGRVAAGTSAPSDSAFAAVAAPPPPSSAHIDETRSSVHDAAASVSPSTAGAANRKRSIGLSKKVAGMVVSSSQGSVSASQPPSQPAVKPAAEHAELIAPNLEEPAPAAGKASKPSLASPKSTAKKSSSNATPSKAAGPKPGRATAAAAAAPKASVSKAGKGELVASKGSASKSARTKAPAKSAVKPVLPAKAAKASASDSSAGPSQPAKAATTAKPSKTASAASLPPTEAPKAKAAKAAKVAASPARKVVGAPASKVAAPPARKAGATGSSSKSAAGSAAATPVDDASGSSSTLSPSIGSVTKFSVVLTSLSTEARDVVLSTVKHLGSLKIVEAVDATTTHIIVGGPRRTLAVLEGMARGCWILKPEWVFVSLEKGHWVDEARFQATDWFAGAADAHTARVAGRVLFRSNPTFYVGKTAAPTEHVHHLVTQLGGRVVASPEQATICLGEPTNRSRRHTSLPGTTTVEVPESWLYDCVLQFKDLPVSQYVKTQRSTKPVTSATSPEY